MSKSTTYIVLGYQMCIDHVLASFPGGFSKAWVASLSGLSANHTPIVAHLDLLVLQALHVPFHPVRPLPLLHINTSDMAKIEVYAA
jgi:hypothetical protein